MNKRLPVIFTGHGSPMNAITPSPFRTGWQDMGNRLEKPKAILAVSAHWYTQGQCVSTADKNRQVYDMYGFPPELYAVKYAPAGSEALGRNILELLGPEARANTEWGIDHGVWSVLCNMYPDADIPVVMMSTDANKTPGELYALGQKLAPLRQEGVLIVASGNVVHNLRLVDWNNEGGYDWAVAFDQYIEKALLQQEPEKVIHAADVGAAYKKAVPTREHFDPLLVALGAAGPDYSCEVWNKGCELGSMSMTSYIFT